jgi:hypothetical protein
MWKWSQQIASQKSQRYDTPLAVGFLTCWTNHFSEKVNGKRKQKKAAERIQYSSEHSPLVVA